MKVRFTKYGSESFALRCVSLAGYTKIGEQMYNYKCTLRCALPALILFCSVAAAQSGKIAIHAGRLIDVTHGTVLRDQLIIVDGERIASVGAWNATAARGAQLIDLSAYTVSPGLIDTHTHLTSDPTTPPYAEFGISIPREALKGAAFARKTLLAGVTTV